MAVVPDTLRFGEFLLDRERHVVMKGGAAVALSPHLVDILDFLASQPGEIVTKDALLERFWRDVHVTENTLTRAIADIRKALGDEAGSPRYIQTAARRGYRFVATTTTAVHEEEDPFREWCWPARTGDARSATASRSGQRLRAGRGRDAWLCAAHTGLANARFLQYQAARATNVPPRDLLDQARTHAQRACELDQTLGEAWATLGFVLTALGEASRRAPCCAAPRCWSRTTGVISSD